MSHSECLGPHLHLLLTGSLCLHVLSGQGKKAFNSGVNENVKCDDIGQTRSGDGHSLSCNWIL